MSPIDYADILRLVWLAAVVIGIASLWPFDHV